MDTKTFTAFLLLLKNSLHISSPCCILLGCFLVSQGLAHRANPSAAIKTTQVLTFGIIVAIITMLTNLAQNQLDAVIGRPLFGLLLESVGSGIIAICGQALSAYVERLSGCHVLRVGSIFLVLGILFSIFQIGLSAII